MLKVMQVGYGYWGANLAKKLRDSSKFDFRIIAELDEDKRKCAAGNYPNIEILDDYKGGLESDIEAVVIGTQTQYSFDIAMDAMKKGKHVFIEKPIAQSLEKAERLVEEARRNNVIIHCDHLMVYNPVIKYIKNMIDKGEMGEISYIDITRANLGPIRRDINSMLDLAVHDIAVVDYLLDGLDPNRIYALGTKGYGDQENLTYLSMKNDNVLINICSSWISPVKIRKTIVAGTKKMVIFDDVQTDKLMVFDSGIEVVPGAVYGSYEYHTRTGDIVIPKICMEDSLRNSLEYFEDCVMKHQDSLSGPKQSLRVMKVLERAQECLSRNKDE